MPQKYSTRRAKPSPRSRSNGNRAFRRTYATGIPIVDISSLLRGGDPAAMRHALHAIRVAARETGLFYLSGHAIPPALLREVYLCSLHHHELAQEFKIGMCSWSGAAHYIADRQSVFGGAAVLERYYELVFSLCRSLLEGCALAMDAPADFFHALYTHPVLRTSLLVRPHTSPDTHAGQGPRACGALTILWADSPEGVRALDPEIPAPAPRSSGGYALCVADTLARWSEDLHISAPHRVLDGRGRARFLIPVFYKTEIGLPVARPGNTHIPDGPEQGSILV